MKITCMKRNSFIYCVQIPRIASKFPFGSLSFLLWPCMWVKFMLNVYTGLFWGFLLISDPVLEDAPHLTTRQYTFQNIQNYTWWNRSPLIKIQKVRCRDARCKMEIRGLEMEHWVEKTKERQKYCELFISELASFTEEWNRDCI